VTSAPWGRPARLSLPVLLALTVLVTVAPFGALTGLATPSPLTAERFRAVLGHAGLIRWMANSFVYAGVSAVLTVLVAAMAGYGFARKRFPGREALFWSFLATLMVPFPVLLIPYFVLVSNLGGVDTYWGLIVPTLANAQAVFLMRQFIADLPDELFQAARIDGAGEVAVFRRIVLPLTTPILATLGLFVFVWHWNDFLWPLVVGQSEQMHTLTVGLAVLQSQNVPQGEVLAGAAISLVPSLLVVALLQRHLVDSVAGAGPMR
jgi:multiple sugar transport system permease protein